MNNSEQTFNEIINLFNGALVKEREKLTFGLSTIPDDNKFTRELTIAKGGANVMSFKESVDIESLKEVGGGIVTNRLFEKAIKTIFLEGINSFQNKPF